MIELAFKDFYDPPDDADCSREVLTVYRAQFPDLYRAADCGLIKTSTGLPCQLGGDTLITYKSVIRKIYGKYFADLDAQTKLDIRSALESFSHTSRKRISYWDSETLTLINNHQIGNMMPFPSGRPSLNSLRATAPLYDAFDGFLIEVERYYSARHSYRPHSELQRAIAYQMGYFDFFQNYNGFIEGNLLQDFEGKNMSAITDFRHYVEVANEIIDRRGRRFCATA